MKKIILIGATILVATTTVIVANNKYSTKEGQKCEQGICCGSEECPLCPNADCCKK
ncbi:MAG: hypothetical protein ACXVNM_11270 [Bacteroidia bacterium]